MRVTLPNLAAIATSAWEEARSLLQDDLQLLQATINRTWDVAHHPDGSQRVPIGQNFVPTGAILAWTTSVAPDGYALCDGSAVSRVTYKALFDIIGVTYGAGDGTLTFNLPDLRGRFPLGKATSGTGSALAGTGGSIDHTHSGGTTGATAPGTDTQGSHSHGGATGSESSHTHRMSEHKHAISSVAQAVSGTDVTVRAQQTQFDIFDSGSGTEVSTGAGTSHSHSISSDGGHSHTVNSHTHAGGTTGTGNPPFIALNYIIKT